MPLPEPRKMSLRLRGAFAAAALALAFAAPGLHAQTDADFLAAKAAFERGERRSSIARARAFRACPRALRRVLAVEARHRHRRPVAVRAFLDACPNTPLAERLRIDWLKSLAQARRLDALRARLRRRRPARTSSSRATASSTGGSVTATPRWAPRSRCGSTGQATPDACEPLFAALIASGELTRRRPPRAFPAGCRGRQPARRAGDRGGLLREGEGHPARIRPQSTSDPQRALAQGAFAWTSPAGQRTRALRARARGADATRSRVPGMGQMARPPSCGERASTATRASRITRARQLDPAANAWYRDVGAAPLTPDAAGVARARGAARASWRDVRAAIERLPERDQQDAAWRYWRARALAAQRRRLLRPTRCYATLAAEVEFLRAARRRGARARRGAVALLKATRRPPTPEALAAFGARPEVARVSSSRSSTCGPSRSANGSTSCADCDDDALLLAAEYARRVGPLRSRDQHRRAHGRRGTISRCAT